MNGPSREEKVHLFDQIVRTTPDLIWMFSADWTELLYLNDGYEELWGRSREALATDPADFLEGVHPDDREAVAEAMEAVAGGSQAEVEYRVNPETDYDRWVWSHSSPLLDERGEVARIAGFTREITERVEATRDLKRQNDRLDTFVGVASHDLRNPLNVAIGRLELARAECDSDHLDQVARAHDRMETLVGEFLSLARHGDRVHETDDVDLAAVASDSWRGVATHAATLQLDVGGAAVRADRSRLQQLFENLFRNAVEHGGEGVSVDVGPLADGSGFYVADDGTGITPADRARVFESGYTTSNEGTGIGLSIVQAIADAHGWSIHLVEGGGGGCQVRGHRRRVRVSDPGLVPDGVRTRSTGGPAAVGRFNRTIIPV